MNPYPLVGLNHFTVPRAISTSPLCFYDSLRSPALDNAKARCPRLPVVVFEAGIVARNTSPMGQGKPDDQRSLCGTDVLMPMFGGSPAMDEAWSWHIRFHHEH